MLTAASIHGLAACIMRAADLASLRSRIDIVRRLYVWADGSPDLATLPPVLRGCERDARQNGDHALAKALHGGRIEVLRHLVTTYGIAA